MKEFIKFINSDNRRKQLVSFKFFFTYLISDLKETLKKLFFTFLLFCSIIIYPFWWVLKIYNLYKEFKEKT